MEDYEKEFSDKLKNNIQRKIKEMNLTQNEIVDKCRDAGVMISQGTISNISNKNKSISFSTVVGLCKGLEIDIHEILPETVSRETVTTSSFKMPTSATNNNAYKGYIGSYHMYFFPTISNKEELLHGELEISPPSDEKICSATMTLHTGDKRTVNGKKVEIIKEYVGEFFISIPMQSGSCILKNDQMDEQCFFVFHHWHIYSNDLMCRMAVAATTSAGSNRRPTIHRLYMCREPLSEENQKYIRGQLRLNESEILIAKEQYERLIREENIPKEFCDTFEKESKVEQYYSVTEAKLVNCNIIEKEFARAISLLRDYSTAPKYNKVSMKTDEFVFEYYQDQN